MFSSSQNQKPIFNCYRTSEFKEQQVELPKLTPEERQARIKKYKQRADLKMPLFGRGWFGLDLLQSVQAHSQGRGFDSLHLHLGP